MVQILILWHANACPETAHDEMCRFAYSKTTFAERFLQHRWHLGRFLTLTAHANNSDTQANGRPPTSAILCVGGCSADGRPGRAGSICAYCPIGAAGGQNKAGLGPLRRGGRHPHFLQPGVTFPFLHHHPSFCNLAGWLVSGLLLQHRHARLFWLCFKQHKLGYTCQKRAS